MNSKAPDSCIRIPNESCFLRRADSKRVILHMLLLFHEKKFILNCYNGLRKLRHFVRYCQWIMPSGVRLVTASDFKTLNFPLLILRIKHIYLVYLSPYILIPVNPLQNY